MKFQELSSKCLCTCKEADGRTDFSIVDNARFRARTDSARARTVSSVLSTIETSVRPSASSK
eukprot:9467864-Pyramimonas_sp.AAC.1